MKTKPKMKMKKKNENKNKNIFQDKGIDSQQQHCLDLSFVMLSA